MELRIVRYKTDLYEWGVGWLDATKAFKWNNYLDVYPSSYPWTVIKPKSEMEAYMIHSIYSIVYLHPMDGLAVLRDDGEVVAFKKFMKELCDACGGKASFGVQEMEFDLEV